MIAELPDALGDGAPLRVYVAPGSPCASIYVPAFPLSSKGPPPFVPIELSGEELWHAADAVRRRIEADPDALVPVRAVLQPVEDEIWFEADEVLEHPDRLGFGRRYVGCPRPARAHAPASPKSGQRRRYAAKTAVRSYSPRGMTMTYTLTTDDITVGDAVTTQLEKMWGWYLAGGIISVIFGFLVISWRHATVYAAIYFASGFFIVGGLFEIVGSVRVARQRWMHLRLRCDLGRRRHRRLRLAPHHHLRDCRLDRVVVPGARDLRHRLLDSVPPPALLVAVPHSRRHRDRPGFPVHPPSWRDPGHGDRHGGHPGHPLRRRRNHRCDLGPPRHQVLGQLQEAAELIGRAGKRCAWPASLPPTVLVRPGLVLGDEIVDLSDPGTGLPTTMRAVLALGSAARPALEAAPHTAAARHSLREVRRHAPVPDPPTILGIGMNYHAHIAELGREQPEWQYWFNKQRTAIVGPG